MRLMGRRRVGSIGLALLGFFVSAVAIRAPRACARGLLLLRPAAPRYRAATSTPGSATCVCVCVCAVSG